MQPQDFKVVHSKDSHAFIYIKVLTFSLSLAPWVFLRCMQKDWSPLIAKCIRIVLYLNDWILCGTTKTRSFLYPSHIDHSVWPRGELEKELNTKQFTQIILTTFSPQCVAVVFSYGTRFLGLLIIRQYKLFRNWISVYIWTPNTRNLALSLTLSFERHNL